MARIVFYEKPGCGGNARQRSALRAAGHEVEVRSILAEPWTAESLRRYFGDKPTGDWFNRASPRVKSGSIRPEALSPEAALAAMIADPLLIRRPLMKVGDRCESGFDHAAVDAWIGLHPSSPPVSDGCIRGNEISRETALPVAASCGCHPRIAAVQGASSAVIQAMLTAFATRLARRGTRLAGVIELSDQDNAGACGRLALRDLATGAVFAISQNLGPGSSACNLDPSGLAQACAAVERAIARGADLVIISKFGKQEAARSGLSDAFRAAVAAGLPVLTSVSPAVREAWAAFAGPVAGFVDADAASVEAWWHYHAGCMVAKAAE